MSDRYDRDRQDVRHYTILGMKWTVAVTAFVVVLCLAVGALLWALSVGTSDIKGRGDAVKQRNSAPNRIFAQQHFEDLKAAIDRDVANIRVAQKSLALNENDAARQANVTGAQQICNGDVTDYNASARKYLERDFRAADLPPSIDLATCE